MFFFTKKRFEKAVAEAASKRIEAKSLIEDERTRDGKYVERTLQVSYEEMWLMYLRNEWVRGCVDKITKSATNSNLFAEAITDETESISPETKAHIEEINTLLEDPNTGLESWKDIRREYLRDILIYDAGGLEIVYDTNGVPVELYSLPGQKIRLNVGKHGTFMSEEEAYYLQGGYWGGRKVEDIPFARKEVIYLVANPKTGSVYGLSPLETLYQSVASDLFAAKYNSDFFKNHAEASGMLGVEGMSEPDLKRFRTYWKAEVKGQPHKMVIVNGKVNWIPMNVSNKDMQFLEYQKWLLCKIMTVYSMQPIVLGIIDPTTGKLNSKEQLTAYKEEAIKPLLEMETYQLTKVLVQQGFGYSDVKISYKSIDVKDEVSDASVAVQVVSGRIMTPNEARKKYFDMKEIEGGDTLSGGLGDIFPQPEQTSMTEEEVKSNLDENKITEEQVKSFGETFIMESPIYDYNWIEKKVVKRGNKWCVIHAHPQKTGSKTDKPLGSVIKCFPTKQQAVKMHTAIVISQARAAGKI